MAQIAISIVNLNCLEHTRNLIIDLDRQTFSDYVVYFYDQNSNEDGTQEFLNQLRQRTNYHVIQNGENKPLNHIWNDFAKANHGAEYICFLNNDIRIASNYLQDSINVLSKDKRVGIAIHATNNRDYSTATTPTRHILEANEIKQGWEFMMRTSEWSDIPSILKFYCGDDYIFYKQYEAKRRIGVITSSPVIHKLSKTREAMGDKFTEDIKKQALLDIENYKKLGYPHRWNNLSKYSRIEPELKQIIEVSVDTARFNVNEYKSRLSAHLDDVQNIPGIVVDVGVSDAATFELLLDGAIKQNKTVLGIDYVENLNKDIFVKGSSNRPSVDIMKKRNPTNYTIKSSGFLNEVFNIRESASFIFIGITCPTKLKAILPKLWDTLSVGGSLFFPYYNYNTCPDCKTVVDQFFKDNDKIILSSRMQTIKGVRDTYRVIKKFTTGVEYKKRDKPLVISSVLKLGAIYDEEYVNKLASAVKRHISPDIDYKFVCLTDSKSESFNMNLIDEIVPLQFDLPGWWSKIELFRPEIFGDSQVLYFDLDTLIVSNINDFASYGGEFLALRDFNTLLSVGSGVLSWDASKCHHVFYKFMREMINNKINLNQFKGGDQEAIEYFLGHRPQWVQDVFPYKMAAFKYQCYNENTGKVIIPDGVSVVCFHGKPKMSDLEGCPVMQQHWR